MINSDRLLLPFTFLIQRGEITFSRKPVAGFDNENGFSSLHHQL
jgi:hypothetical protein